jgi:uncharacterized membrane protein YhaH (DUF805 family)
MLNIYFGEWGSGKLQRLPYLGYYVLLTVLVMAIIIGGIMAVGMTENLMGGNIADTQKLLLDKFGIIAILGIAVLGFATVLAQVNILGKRIRDIGLPVLWTILGIIAVSLVLNLLFPPQEVMMSAASVQTANGSATTMTASATSTSMVVQLFDLAIFLALLFIPSNSFSSKNHY